jgi:hypothetical protein
MKRISLEQAKKYIPIEDDLVNQNIKSATYFTLSPYPDPEMRDKGWEKVTYFTSKQKNVFTNGKEGNQWIYILSNPSIPNALKIGYTNLTPELRAKQISASTGVVVPFKVEWTVKCNNGYELEKIIHKTLKDYRINNQREFFQIDLEEAKTNIKLIIENFV